MINNQLIIIFYFLTVQKIYLIIQIIILKIYSQSKTKINKKYNLNKINKNFKKYQLKIK